jgi:hypothetical protein
MLTQEQLNKIISKNEYLRVQLKEANEMLTLREEEIEILEQNAADITQLRSHLKIEQLNSQSLQNKTQYIQNNNKPLVLLIERETLKMN